MNEAPSHPQQARRHAIREQSSRKGQRCVRHIAVRYECSGRTATAAVETRRERSCVHGREGFVQVRWVLTEGATPRLHLGRPGGSPDTSIGIGLNHRNENYVYAGAGHNCCQVRGTRSLCVPLTPGGTGAAGGGVEGGAADHALQIPTRASIQERKRDRNQRR